MLLAGRKAQRQGIERRTPAHTLELHLPDIVANVEIVREEGGPAGHISISN